LLLFLQSVQSYERIVLFRLGLLSASLGPGVFHSKCRIALEFYLTSVPAFYSESRDLKKNNNCISLSLVSHIHKQYECTQYWEK